MHHSIQGIVINRKVLKETDLLMTILTPSLGKVICLAKGAKNIKSSRLPTLQLGNIIKASLYEKNHQFWLSESVATTAFLQTQKTLTQLNLLFYFLELINRLVGENQNIPSLYQIAQNIIIAINQNHFVSYIQNEIKLLDILGFGTPPEISTSFAQKDYHHTQALIKSYLESLIEKPLESNKLFK